MKDNCSYTYLCKPRNQAYICHIWVNQLLVDMCRFHHLISFDGKIYLDGDIFLLIEFQQFFRCCSSVASSNSHCCTEIQILFLKPFHFIMIKPPFSWSIHIISRLINHLTATYNYSKMYLILWNVGIYSSIFSGYDLKHKKRQNNALKTWF